MERKIGSETQKLLNGVDVFAEKMKKRLLEKAAKEGYSGWESITSEDAIIAIEERIPRLYDLSNNEPEVGIANWLLIYFLNRKNQQNG